MKERGRRASSVIGVTRPRKELDLSRERGQAFSYASFNPIHCTQVSLRTMRKTAKNRKTNGGSEGNYRFQPNVQIRNSPACCKYCNINACCTSASILICCSSTTGFNSSASDDVEVSLAGVAGGGSSSITLVVDDDGMCAWWLHNSAAAG